MSGEWESEGVSRDRSTRRSVSEGVNGGRREEDMVHCISEGVSE